MTLSSKQTALITGGATRLGKEISKSLAKKGFNLVIHYFSSKIEALELQKELQEFDIQVVTLQADLTKDNEIENVIPHSLEELQTPLNLLVNNASIFKNDSIENATLTSWDEHISTNLKAPYFLTRDFANQLPEPFLDEKGENIASGLIINVVDQRVLKPTPYFSTYTVAKMALWSFTRTSALALAPKVRVNAIGPGPTIKASFQPNAHFENQRYNTLLRRGSDPSDVTGALNYFLEAKSVTGQLVCTDGGQHLTWNPKYNGEDF